MATNLAKYEDKKMKVVQIDHAWREPARIEYYTDVTSIRQAAEQFGRTSDTVELWDDKDRLVAIATWPQGGKAYKYCTSPDVADIPGAWRY